MAILCMSIDRIMIEKLWKHIITWLNSRTKGGSFRFLFFSQAQSFSSISMSSSRKKIRKLSTFNLEAKTNPLLCLAMSHIFLQFFKNFKENIRIIILMRCNKCEIDSDCSNIIEDMDKVIFGRVVYNQARSKLGYRSAALLFTIKNTMKCNWWNALILIELNCVLIFREYNGSYQFFNFSKPCLLPAHQAISHIIFASCREYLSLHRQQQAFDCLALP